MAGGLEAEDIQDGIQEVGADAFAVWVGKLGHRSTVDRPGEG